MYNSMPPRELHNARAPCLSPSGVSPSVCPLNQWCHPIISSSVSLFSFCLWSFPASGSFQCQLFSSGGQSIGASASVLSVNIQGWIHLGLTGVISLQSKGLLTLFQYHSSKASILLFSAFFMVQLSYLYMTTGKTIVFSYMDFCQQSDLCFLIDSLGLS